MMKPGDRVRLSPRGAWHIVWGTHTICHRKITEDAEVWPKGEPLGDRKPGHYCRACRTVPVVSFTFASGAQQRWYAR